MSRTITLKRLKQETLTSPKDNKWTIPSGTGWLGAQSVGTVPNFYTRSMSLPYMPNTTTQMNPPFAITPPNPQPATISAPFTCFISAPPPAGLVQIVNEEGVFSYLPEEELKTLDLDLYKTLKINPDFYDQSTFEGQEIASYLDSLEATNAGKIYRFEEKVIGKDTLGALSEVDGILPSTDIEQNFKIVNDIYWRTWFMGIYSFSPEDSVALFDVAYQDPIYGGTAVFSARVMLGIDVENSSTRRSSNSISSNTILEPNFVRFFPNPATDYVNYEITLEPNESASLEIVDLFGRIIFSKKIDYDSKTGFIDFEEKAVGFYSYRVNLKGKTETGKLVIE